MMAFKIWLKEVMRWIPPRDKRVRRAAILLQHARRELADWVDDGDPTHFRYAAEALEGAIKILAGE